MQTKQVCVIAVSGTSGAGKTTLIRSLATLLQDAVLLSFDDYVYLGNDVNVIRTWLAGGANPNELQTPQLAIDLRKLSSGQPVQLPNNDGVLEPAAFILLEEPFGRARNEIAPMIEFAAHLDLPADVALARRLVRTLESAERPALEHLLEQTCHDLRTYLIAGRDAYRAVEDAAKACADIVLDGMRSVDELAAELISEMHRRRV